MQTLLLQLLGDYPCAISASLWRQRARNRLDESRLLFRLFKKVGQLLGYSARLVGLLFPVVAWIADFDEVMHDLVGLKILHVGRGEFHRALG